MNRQQFFKQFVYDVEKDFDVDGVPAKWAEEVKPGLRYWGDDDDCIGIPHAGDTETKGSTSAISPDKKLIAAASGLTISVFHIATKERRAQFGGLTKTCSGLRFLPCSNVEAGYQLVYGQAREGEEENQLF